MCDINEFLQFERRNTFLAVVSKEVISNRFGSVSHRPKTEVAHRAFDSMGH